MWELPLVFVAGALGSSHCLGMCGPFALAIGGGARDWRRNLLRQGAYTIGRIFTYAVLGAVAGFVGWRLRTSLPWLTNTAAALSILAGLFLLYQGLLAAGIIPKTGVTDHQGGACLGGSFLKTFLRSPGWSGVFLAGVFTGLLPCGLVYGFLALAAGTGSLPLGMATMVAFGLGTGPVMMAAGTGASLLSGKQRVRLIHAAAWCVVLTGVISIARGASFLEIPGYKQATGCPACRAAEQPAP